MPGIITKTQSQTNNVALAAPAKRGEVAAMKTITTEAILFDLK